MAMWVPSKLVNLHRWLPCSDPSESTPVAVEVTTTTTSQVRKGENKSTRTGSWLITPHCTPLQQQTYDGQAHKQEDDDEDGQGIMCEPCNGKGWLLCDFCKGQKTNVKAVNNRIYRRCPNCKALGYVLCPNCKVFKCVTYPDYSDGEL